MRIKLSPAQIDLLEKGTVIEKNGKNWYLFNNSWLIETDDRKEYFQRRFSRTNSVVLDSKEATDLVDWLDEKDKHLHWALGNTITVTLENVGKLQLDKQNLTEKLKKLKNKINFLEHTVGLQTAEIETVNKEKLQLQMKLADKNAGFFKRLWDNLK